MKTTNSRNSRARVSVWIGITALLVTAFAGAIAAQQVEPAGGGEHPLLPRDEMTEQQRLEIQQQIDASIQRLEREGKFLNFSPLAVPLSWPVAKAPGVSDFNVDGISNFVDQNPAFPNQLLDYNCGTRTYDQASGYNHRGIDIFTWPFGWRKMDFNEVIAVAAAPGTIVLKSDGNFDRSCGFNSNNWNAVYVRHADNSVAWYGHFKNGSLTAKAVGDTVAAGERLGVVGSSGNSTGPHLHFELYNAAGQLQDPYQGTCNSMNNFSWWAQQPSYRVTQINKLMTQSAGPIFPACPQQEITNEKNVFRGGETLVTAGYYRDQLVGQQTQYSIVRPDGAAFTNWSHNSPNTYAASYWWWSWSLPSNARNGVWKFRATFNGQNYEKNFVVPHSPFNYDTDRRADLSVFRPGENRWYIQRGTAGYIVMDWGEAGDKIAPADYDGDGGTDVAVFRPSNGTWYVFNVGSQTFETFSWGAPGDLPVPADHDGDGRADLVVYRESDNTWYTRFIATGGMAIRQFGEAGDKPVRGDFDADGIWDIAVYRPSDHNWYIAKSTAGYFVQTWGEPGDVPVPADYDGDGATDIAIFRPSTGQWFRIRSTAGFDVVNWGQAGDVPIPADYDGDGRSDAVVFRPAEGNWYMNQSSAGFLVLPFGQAGDIPTQSAFLY
jgi:murein DD-endopeptidase MepM/ murein hydrolase activator NlpD